MSVFCCRSIQVCIKSHNEKFNTSRHPTSLICLTTERASLTQTSKTSGGLAQHLSAVGAQDNALGMGVDGGDGQATRALDIQEVTVGCLDQLLKLVLSLLFFLRRVQQIDIHFVLFCALV